MSQISQSINNRSVENKKLHELNIQIINKSDNQTNKITYYFKIVINLFKKIYIILNLIFLNYLEQNICYEFFFNNFFITFFKYVLRLLLILLLYFLFYSIFKRDLIFKIKPLYFKYFIYSL